MALWRWQHPASHVQAQMPFLSEPLSFADLPGWSDDDLDGALEAFLATAAFFPEGQILSAAARAAAASPDGARRFFEERFVPRLVRPGDSRPLLTGYFEPEIAGALAPSPAAAIPIYGLPPDLELAGPDAAASGLPADHTAGRRVGGRLLPYFSRGEIERGALAGRRLEIAWAQDPVDLFVMHVQGSGLLRLPEGRGVRLTFAGKNGHPYVSLARLLVQRGEIMLEGSNLETLLAWLRADAARGRSLMSENPSYIFFKFLPEDAYGPTGSAGAPLAATRSLAVDPACHRMGSPIWVSAPSLRPDGRPFARLMITQDTGSAIRGPARGDVYWGSGAAAGAIAGATKHECEFYVLALKS